MNIWFDSIEFEKYRVRYAVKSRLVQRENFLRFISLKVNNNYIFLWLLCYFYKVDTLIRTTSAASTATSVPVPMAMPTSAWARAGESLTPSPTIATFIPCFWSCFIFFTLWEGNTSANTLCIPIYQMKKKKQTCYVNKRIEIICLFMFSKVDYNKQKHIITTHPTPFPKKNKPILTVNTLYILYKYLQVHVNWEFLQGFGIKFFN